MLIQKLNLHTLKHLKYLSKFTRQMFCVSESNKEPIKVEYKPRMYGDVNLKKSKDYHDFEGMKLNLG